METHGFPAIYDKDSKILILGSFPSVVSRKENFYYANPTNRFWRVLEILFNTKLDSIETKKKFLYKNHIALYDSILSCEIKSSSDSSIRKVIPTNLKEIVDNSNIKMIFCNGKTSYNYYMKYNYPKVLIQPIILPSSSAANAKLKLDDLVESYKVIKDYL